MVLDAPLAESAAPAWMTLLQASEALGVHMNTVRRWADSGAISSYRTPGGHRRLAERDVRALSSERQGQPVADAGHAVLDASTVGLLESALRGDVSSQECRLRLRSVGREHGRAAARAGARIADLLAEHATVRRAIVSVADGSGVATREDLRRWAGSMADAVLMGLSEGIDTIPERARMRSAG